MIAVDQLITVRCRYCRAPRVDVPEGTPYRFRCCKIEQQGKA